MRPYWERDGITLWLGDARDVLPTLERVDHCITDPPYSEYVHSKSRAGARVLDATGFPSDFSRAVDFGFEPLDSCLRAFIATEVARLAARWVLVFSDELSAADWRDDCLVAGFDYVRTGAWIKLNGSPQFTGDRPGVGFETISIFHAKGRKRWNGGGLPAVWSHAVVKNRGGDDPRLHTTQKPLPLMRELVELFTDPGDLILDPFCGSGATLVAAYGLGRRAIGVEIDEKYAEVAAKRLEGCTPPLPLVVAPPAEQGAMPL